MFKITNYLKEYKKESILAPCFKMLEASFDLFVPLVMAAIVDTGIKNADNTYYIPEKKNVYTSGVSTINKNTKRTKKSRINIKKIKK